MIEWLQSTQWHQPPLQCSALDKTRFSRRAFIEIHQGSFGNRLRKEENLIFDTTSALSLFSAGESWFNPDGFRLNVCVCVWVQKWEAAGRTSEWPWTYTSAGEAVVSICSTVEREQTVSGAPGVAVVHGRCEAWARLFSSFYQTNVCPTCSTCERQLCVPVVWWPSCFAACFYISFFHVGVHCDAVKSQIRVHSVGSNTGS